MPNGNVVDMIAEMYVDDCLPSLYVEAKSWRFDERTPSYLEPDAWQGDSRFNRMKEKLSRQLPACSVGVWAWDKMRDVISGGFSPTRGVPTLGTEERRIIHGVCTGVPQLAVVLVKLLSTDLTNIIWAFPSNRSRWPTEVVAAVVGMLNASATAEWRRMYGAGTCGEIEDGGTSD